MISAAAIILLAQASQPWLVPSQSYEPLPPPSYSDQPPKATTDSPVMFDSQGGLTYQPFNESQQWPAYVEPVTPRPYGQEQQNDG